MQSRGSPWKNWKMRPGSFAVLYVPFWHLSDDERHQSFARALSLAPYRTSSRRRFSNSPSQKGENYNFTFQQDAESKWMERAFSPRWQSLSPPSIRLLSWRGETNFFSISYDLSIDFSVVRFDASFDYFPSLSRIHWMRMPEVFSLIPARSLMLRLFFPMFRICSVRADPWAFRVAVQGNIYANKVDKQAGWRKDLKAWSFRNLRFLRKEYVRYAQQCHFGKQYFSVWNQININQESIWIGMSLLDVKGSGTNFS